MKPIYMDNNATTACDPAVVEAMLPFFTEQFGNASSIHSFGSQVGKALKEARVRVQTLLGAAYDSEIVFNSCGTESDSTAILSAIKAQPERKTIITTVVEHPAILTLCDQLEKEGYVVHKLKVNKKGRVDLDEYKALLNDRVAIVSVMWANNETGTIFPVEEMAEMAHEKGIMFHTDAVQAVGKLPIDLKTTKIDMLSLSGHKLHAPKGIGVLYVRRNTRFRPLLRGGHQERGRRAGTENSASIVGLGVACELAQQHMEAENTTVKRLRDRLERGILTKVKNAFVNGDTLYRLPNTASIAFEYVEGEGILLLLNKQGIAASSGSACTSGSLESGDLARAPRRTAAENETEWHRAWKNQFPAEWQEVVHQSSDGERHIADVRTWDGWTLEFQHSAISAEERQSRESYYEALIWVVDGLRRKRDAHQLVAACSSGQRERDPFSMKRRVSAPAGSLLRDWAGSSAHVFFDLGEPARLWWLFPCSNRDRAYVQDISREAFVRIHRERTTHGPTEFDERVDNFRAFVAAFETPPDTPAPTRQSARLADARHIMLARRGFRF